jgi:hypothetical protein
MTNHDPYINDFANRSFRDLADQDYISARVAYRNEFDQQFRWCSLQAIEKYFKAILLYNRISTKGLGHDLNKALQRVQGITDLEFTIPADVEEFVDYISVYGADRYLSHPTHLKNEALLTLDKSVWYIRRYCLFMRQVVIFDGGVKELFESNKQKATNPYFEEHQYKYKIFGGYLEKIVGKRLPAYDDLVWKNFFYGRANKHKIKNFKFRVSSQNPTHALHEEVFDTLDSLVDFPKAIRRLYKS